MCEKGGEKGIFGGRDMRTILRGMWLVSFYIKANNAAAAGASAILIVNNEEDDVSPDLSGMTYHIPYFIVPLACYDLLMESEEATFTLGTLEEYVP